MDMGGGEEGTFWGWLGGSGSGSGNLLDVPSEIGGGGDWGFICWSDGG